MPVGGGGQQRKFSGDVDVDKLARRLPHSDRQATGNFSDGGQNRVDALGLCGKAVSKFSGHREGKPLARQPVGDQFAECFGQSVGFSPDGKRHGAAGTVAVSGFQVCAADVEADDM